MMLASIAIAYPLVRWLVGRWRHVSTPSADA
jgi:hypothetical protein